MDIKNLKIYKTYAPAPVSDKYKAEKTRIWKGEAERMGKNKTRGTPQEVEMKQ